MTKQRLNNDLNLDQYILAPLQHFIAEFFPVPFEINFY